MPPTKTKANRPAPPEDLDGEALLEWGRVCDELDAGGRLDTTDRAIVTLYVRAWATHHDAARHVAKFGSVVKYTGNPGANPFYKVQKETATLMRGLLADMGLTPVARGAPAKPDDDDDDLPV